MYQSYDGQWYDNNGNPVADPATQSLPVESGTGRRASTGLYNPNAPPLPSRSDGAFDATGQLPNSGGSQPASPATGPFWPSYSFTPYSGFTPFSYDSYTPLSADQAASEPGYDFAKQQGRDAVQTSQAARGNVLSGAALKDLFAWGDQFAGQNYQNAEARNENVYNMNRGNAYNNWAANETGKYQQWQGNLQPAQFAANLGTQQGSLTLADLFNRFNTTANAYTNIATAGAR